MKHLMWLFSILLASVIGLYCGYLLANKNNAANYRIKESSIKTVSASIVVGILRRVRENRISQGIDYGNAYLVNVVTGIHDDALKMKAAGYSLSVERSIKAIDSYINDYPEGIWLNSTKYIHDKYGTNKVP